MSSLRIIVLFIYLLLVIIVVVNGFHATGRNNVHVRIVHFPVTGTIRTTHKASDTSDLRQLLSMKSDVSFSTSQSINQSVTVVRTALTKSLKSAQSVLRSLPLVIIGLFLKLQLRLNRLSIDVQSAANAMEQGWTKRSSGGSVRRTVEVWIFAIKYIIKYVSNANIICSI